RVVDQSHDPRTLADWGRSVAVSSGAIRNWCQTAGISARNSLWFARTLRAVIEQFGTAGAPENLLDIVDSRTLSRVLRAAGGTGDALPNGLQQFLNRQTFVTDNSAIAVVAAVLQARCLEPASMPPNLPKQRLSIDLQM